MTTPTTEHQSKDRAGRWSVTGALLSALAASVCCIGPLVLLALGIGGAWAGGLQVLEPYRPLSVVLTVGFLALAFYRAYRRPATAACGPDGTCAIPRSNRITRIAPWVMTPIIFALLAVPYLAPHLLRKTAAGGAVGQVTDGTARAVLRVENLTCASCAAAARQSLLQVDGVKDAQVTADPPVAIVSFDPARTSVEALTAATARAGYPSSAQQDAASADCCNLPAAPAGRAAGGPATVPAKGDEPADPEHEVVFNVERLGCPLVKGVGCGHLLAPTLARLDHIDGVSRSFSNWTGTRLRVSVAPTADREAVAARVRDYLRRQQYEPRRVEVNELAKALKGEDWRSANHIHELSSFEFRTLAWRRVEAFGQREGLEQAATNELLGIVDELWEKSGEGKGTPSTDGDGYAAYWNGRIASFKTALLKRAADVLTAEQVTRLAKEDDRRQRD